MSSASLHLFESNAPTVELVRTMPDLSLRTYQAEAELAVDRDLQAHRGALVVLPTGCHRAGQLIMRADGSLAPVELIRQGDELMGLDSAPRRVLHLARGRGEMVEIIPVKGEPWVVNMDHILTLVSTPSKPGGSPSQRGGVVVDVTVREWLGWSKTRKHIHKLFRVPVAFPERAAPTIDPYVFGVLLGDGCLISGVQVTTPDREIWPECEAEGARWGLKMVEAKSVDKCPAFSLVRTSGKVRNALYVELESLGVNVESGEKFLPDAYKYGSAETRLEVLAGLLDTDGHLIDSCYDYISKSPRLAHDVAFVARSLGLSATVVECLKGCQTGAVGIYHRVYLSGDCDAIRCRVTRKRAAPRTQKKSVLRTGFKVRVLPEPEDYYGFELDGDHRYLLGDFTVTHNTGKSRLAGAVVWRQKLAGRKVLVLSPTIVLCRQMYSDMRKLGLWADIEQADNRAVRPLPDVTIASVASMRGSRLASFKPDDFGLVIADECHRSVSDAYTAIFSHFASAKRLGLTATPDRVDGVSLANAYDVVSYEMSMLDAIEAGWLVPLRFKTASTDWDPSKIRERQGECDPGSVAKELVRSGLLHSAAGTLAELSEGERTVAFLPTVASSKAFTAELLARNVSAAHIDGETPEAIREDTFRRFVDGDIRVISNVAVLTEGWDCPAASVIALLSPTKSRSKVAQMIGRGTRLLPGKTHTTVLDFCPGRLRKGRLASPADALAGKMLDDAVHAQLSEEGDLADAIERATEKAAEIQARKERAEAKAKERAAKIAAMRAEVKARKYSYVTRDHEMRAMFGRADDAGTTRTTHGDGPDESEDARRQRLGLASLKQERILASKGMRRDLPRKMAGEVMGMLAANGWQVSEKMRNDKRFWEVAK